MDIDNPAPDKYISRAQAAEYIRETYGVTVSRKTLQKYVTVGGGPAYRRWGRAAVYRTGDLDEWVQRKLSAPRVSSSAAQGAA